jgi:primosomal replication protein N
MTYSPARVPRQRLWLEHRSRQLEDGHPREVKARIAVIFVGSKTALIADLEQGHHIRVKGWLSRAGYKGFAQEQLQLVAETLTHLQ